LSGDKASGNWLNKNNLIIGGVITVVTVGGILIYRHFSKKSNAKKENIQSISLNVGLCVKCNKPLVDSGYVPANNVNNEDAHIVCKSCGEKNFAKYNAE